MVSAITFATLDGAIDLLRPHFGLRDGRCHPCEDCPAPLPGDMNRCQPMEHLVIDGSQCPHVRHPVEQLLRCEFEDPGRSVNDPENPDSCQGFVFRSVGTNSIPSSVAR
jgi:hypothetical protein